MRSTEQYPRQYLHRQIAAAKRFMDEHFADGIDLNRVADHAHFSKFHFLRLFKTLYGVTPNQYLIALRIDKARQLLAASATVRDACAGIGFESLSSFKALFKRHTLVTPAAYRQQQYQRRLSMQQSPEKHIPGCLLKKAIFKMPPA